MDKVLPFIFVLGYVAYTAAGILFFSLVSDQFTLHYETFLFIGLGLFFYSLGCRIVLPDVKNFYLLVLVGFAALYSYQEFGGLGLVLPVIVVAVLLLLEKAKGEWLFCAGILFLLLQLLVGGVPLLHPELRKNIGILFLFGYVFLFLGIAFMTRTWDAKHIFGFFLGSLALLSLFTFRVYVLELAIVVFVSLYMMKKINFRSIVVSALPLFVLILILGYLGVAYQAWKFNPLGLFLFRPAFTFGVLNRIVEEASYFGIAHGRIWLNFSSATVIGPHLFGYESNITSTILGPLIFDGGIIELVVMVFFGAALNTMYRRALSNYEKIPYYAIVLAVFLVCIDVSFIPSIVLLILAGLYISEK